MTRDEAERPGESAPAGRAVAEAVPATSASGESVPAESVSGSSAPAKSASARSAPARAASAKSADAYRTISEVAADLDLPQHVLRFWESRFPQLRPLKRAGGRRFYRPADVALLRLIRARLYGEGYTIKGVQRLLRERGGRDQGPEPADAEVINHDSADDVSPAAAATVPLSVEHEAAQPDEAATAADDNALSALPNPREGGGGESGLAALRELLETVELCERRLRRALGPAAG